MKDWQEFVNRSPEDYEKWIIESNLEIAQFEIAELIRTSKYRRVIVDINFHADNEVSKRFAQKFGYERQFSSAYMKHTEGRFSIGEIPVR